MTIANVSARSATYTGNAATVAFPFSFAALSTAEVKVSVNGVEQTSGYSVALNARTGSGGAYPGGTVTFTSAPANLSSVIVYSEPSFAQGIQFENAGAFLPASHDDVSDQEAIRDIYLKDRSDRSIRAPLGETLGDLPALSVRIGKFAGFDASGNPVALSGTGNDAALRTDLAVTTGAGLVGFDPAGSYGGASLAAYVKRLYLPDGTQRSVTSAGGVNAAKRGENLLFTNSATTGQHTVRYAAVVKTGNLSDGTNDSSDTLISRWENITNGFGWARWNVASGPLNPASGLPTAPAGVQNFAVVTAEHNPQNRHSSSPWEAEARRMVNWVGGDQMVAETQDFTALLGPGIRRGYNIAFGYLISRSAYTNDDQQKHARFNTGIMLHPNSISPDGAFLFGIGYRQFPVAIAISAAGTGYTVGDQLTFNTGLDQGANENTIVRVKTVNGGGGITAAEIFVAGSYQSAFASPIGVTGGTGTGAQFTYTLSDDTLLPRAYAGICGRWKYGIDAQSWPGSASSAGSATFAGAMFRAPNNQMIIVARNAAGNADVGVAKVNASDEVEIGQPGKPFKLLGNKVVLGTALQDFADDTAAAAGGIAIRQLYRTGSAVKVRVV